MVSYFSGGVLGTAVAGVAHARFGWTGISLVGVAYAVAALALWFTEARWPLPRRRHRQSTQPGTNVDR